MSKQPQYKSIEDDPLAGMSLIEKAEVILGPRLLMDALSYKLDGKRVSVFQVIKAAGLELGRV
jgi:hypothetical protein